mgnify:CR=1 FL=1
MKRKVIPFERTFRALDAMMFVDVMDWFAGYPLKWEVSVTPRLVKLRMKCKCHKAFDVIPCPDCACKETKQCTGCLGSFQKRYVKQGKLTVMRWQRTDEAAADTTGSS